MLRSMKGARLPLHGWIAIALLVASEALMLRKIEPFASYYYSFAWWSYILLIDAIIYWRRGNSLLMNRRREFWVMIPWSVAIWLLFEAFNFRLQNWYYSNMEPFSPARWAGYFVAYATVLPGLFETLELLESLRLFSGVSGPRHRFSSSARATMMVAGAAMLLVSLIFPGYGFSLAWLGFVFLLDPLLYSRGGRSLLKKIEEEGPVKIYRLMVSGVICGFLWEFWNFWANIKWHYTVPFFDEIKLFEMPVMGFLGFAPFAVECYVIYAFVCLFRDSRWWEAGVVQPSGAGSGGRKGRSLALAAVMAIFFLVMFHALDKYAVDSYASTMRDFALVSPEELKRIESLGLGRVEDFHHWAQESGTKRVSAVIGIPEEKALQIEEMVSLSLIKGMGARNARLLTLAGINTAATLARQQAGALHKKLCLVNSRYKVRKEPPRVGILKNWILSARSSGT